MRVLIFLILSCSAFASEVDDAIARLSSPDSAIRKASAVILGKSNSQQATEVLVAALTDQDSGVREAACVSLWEQPRPYTADAASRILMSAAGQDPIVQQYVVENLGIILSILTQRNAPNNPQVANQNPFRAALLPHELGLVEQLFQTENPKLLRHMVGYYFMVQPRLEPARVLGWLRSEDDSVSLAALNMGLPISAILPLLQERWPRATEAWQLQCVQMLGGHPEVNKWLQTINHPNPKVGELVLITLELQKPPTIKGLRALRPKLTTPLAIQRWARTIPQLQKDALPLALEVLEHDQAATPTVIESWGHYQTPLPESLAITLLGDRRRNVRQFATNFIRSPNKAQVHELCQSEWLDVRLVGIRHADVDELEEQLIDERQEVRTAAICRWLQVSTTDIDKILLYGLNDPLCQDNILMAVAGKPEFAPLLKAWANTPERKGKLQSAQPPTILTLPATAPRP